MAQRTGVAIMTVSPSITEEPGVWPDQVRRVGLARGDALVNGAIGRLVLGPAREVVIDGELEQVYGLDEVRSAGQPLRRP
jgi:hypothetical protein